MSETGPVGPRSRRTAWIVSALAGGCALVVAAAVGIAYMVIADDGEVRPGGRSATPGRSAPSAPSPPSAGPEFFSADSPDLTALPDACTSVAPGTVRRLVPGAEMSRPDTPPGIGGQLKRLCEWELLDDKARTLDVRLVMIRSGPTVNGARLSSEFMGRIRKEANGPRPKGTKINTVRRIDMGSEAFLYYRLWHGEALGGVGKAQVTVRVRNVIIEVGYSGTDNLPDKWYEDSNETGLPKAAATQGALQVTREIIPHVVNQA